MDVPALLDPALALVGLAAQQGSATIGGRLGEKIASLLGVTPAEFVNEPEVQQRENLEALLHENEALRTSIADFVNAGAFATIEQGDGSVAFTGNQTFNATNMKFGGS
jgi:hypothetical protein